MRQFIKPRFSLLEERIIPRVQFVVCAAILSVMNVEQFNQRNENNKKTRSKPCMCMRTRTSNYA
jgi:hypothetical protein